MAVFRSGCADNGAAGSEKGRWIMGRLIILIAAAYAMHHHGQEIDLAGRGSVFAPLWLVQQNSTLQRKAVTYGWSGPREAPVTQRSVKYGW